MTAFRKTCPVFVWFGLSAAFAVSQQAFAQSAAPVSAAAGNSDETVALSPFVVQSKGEKGYYVEDSTSGARYAQSLLDTAGAIEIVNHQLIEDLNEIGSVHNVLTYGISGLTEQRRILDGFQLRGINTRDTFRNNIVSPVSGSSMGTYDVERIEVIKGPAAMITGFNSTSIGGLFNMITKQPTEVQQGDMSVGVGDHDFQSVQLNASGPILLSPKGGVKVLYRVTGADYYDDIGPSVDSHHDEFYSAALKIVFDPATVWNLYGYYEFLDRKVSFAVLDPVALAQGRVAINRDVPAGLSGSRSKDQRKDEFTFMLESEFTHTFNEHLALRWVYGLGRDHPNTQRRIILAGYNYVTHIASRTFNANTEMLTTNQTQIDVVYKTQIGPFKNEASTGGDFLSQEALNYWTLSATKIAGINVFAPDYSQDENIESSVIAANPPNNGDTDQTSTHVSEYLQDVVSFWHDKIIVVGGLRWLQPQSQTLNFATGLFSRTFGPDRRVYKLGAVYKVLPGLSAYVTKMANFVSAAEILNSGTPYQFLLADGYGVDTEGGLKWSLFNGHLYGDAAYYQLKETNQPENTNISYNGETIQQSSDIKSQGAEMSIGTRVEFRFGNLDLLFNYSDAYSTDATHVQLPDDSTYVHSAVVKWTFLEGFPKNLSIGAAVRGQSTKHDNNLSLNIPQTMDAFASYRWGRFTIQANADNLTNKYYALYMIGYSATAAPMVTGSVETSLPARLNMTVRYAF